MGRFRRSGTVAIVVLAVLLTALVWLHRRTTAYDDGIEQAAARNGLDFNLIKALIYEESWFRPDIRGGAGELGLMQVSMAAARDFAVGTGFPAPTEERVLEPALNIEIGSWYLRQSLDHYKDSPAPLVFALVRYNAGDARAEHWRRLLMARPAPPGMSVEEHALSLIDYPKTRAYTRRILKRYRSGRIWF